MTETRPPAPPAPSGQDTQPQRYLGNRKVAQILTAATALFLEHGFEIVTMDMVSAASGVSKSTLYVYFKSKEELFVTVVDEETRRIKALIWTEGLEKADVESLLRQVARSFFNVFMTDRGFAFKRIVLGALPRFPEVGRITFRLGPAKLMAEIAGFLATAHNDGRLTVPNPTLSASQFVGLVQSDVEMRGLLMMEPPSEAEVDEIIDAAVNMFLAYHRRAEQRRS